MLLFCEILLLAGVSWDVNKTLSLLLKFVVEFAYQMLLLIPGSEVFFFQFKFKNYPIKIFSFFMIWVEVLIIVKHDLSFDSIDKVLLEKEGLWKKLNFICC